MQQGKCLNCFCNSLFVTSLRCLTDYCNQSCLQCSTCDCNCHVYRIWVWQWLSCVWCLTCYMSSDCHVYCVWRVTVTGMFDVLHIQCWTSYNGNLSAVFDALQRLSCLKILSVTMTVVCSVSECNNDSCVLGVCPFTRSETRFYGVWHVTVAVVSTLFNVLQWLVSTLFLRVTVTCVYIV